MLDGGTYLMNSAQQNLLDEILSIKNLHAPCRRDFSQRGKVSHAGTGPSHLSETLTIELTNKGQRRNYRLRFSYLLLVSRPYYCGAPCPHIPRPLPTTPRPLIKKDRKEIKLIRGRMEAMAEETGTY